MARLLLDTHALFWALYDDASLSDAAGTAIRDPANAVYATMASAQEIALNLSVGKWRAALDLLLRFDVRLESEGYGLIVPTSTDYANQLRLPDVPGHKDPYDKLIVAQAIGRDMVLVTADSYAPRYEVECIEAGQGREREARSGRIVPEGRLEPIDQPDPIELSGPIYSHNQIIFQKIESQLIIAAYDTGLFVVHGWTVSIGLDDLRKYAARFGRNAGQDVHGGFFFHDNSFILIHQGAKLTLMREEGTAIVRLLSDRYGLTIADHLL